MDARASIYCQLSELQDQLDEFCNTVCCTPIEYKEQGNVGKYTLTAGINGFWSASDELGLLLLSKSKSLLDIESSGSDLVICLRFSFIVVGHLEYGFVKMRLVCNLYNFGQVQLYTTPRESQCEKLCSCEFQQTLLRLI